MAIKPGPPYTHGRILNRHKRGRPRFSFFRRLVSRSRRLIPVLVIIGLGAGVYFGFKLFGLL